MKRVLVLGGTGMTGRAVLDYLDCHGESLTVHYASRHASDRLKQPWAHLDLGWGVDRIARVLSDYDHVVVCVGPFEKLRARVHGCCRAAGVGCVDVNDSIDARRDIVAMDATAQQAGLTFLTGFGLCPGISTMMLTELAEDPGASPIVDIEVRLLIGGKQEPGAASMESMFATLTSPWRALVDGVERQLPPEVVQSDEPGQPPYLVGYECPDIDRVQTIFASASSYRYRAWFGQIGADSVRRMQRMRVLSNGWAAARLAKLGARVGARRVEKLRPVPENTTVEVIVTDQAGARRTISAGGAPSFRLTGACAGACVAAWANGEFTAEPGVKEMVDLPEARAAIRRRLVDDQVSFSAVETG